MREGETFLFDCGEGTQHQIMRYGVAFSLRDIFFSHMHVDHMLGMVGLVRTMALQGREEPLRMWGPPGSSRMLKRAETLGADRLDFPVEYHELQPGETVSRKGYEIVAFAADHMRTPALGYALVESLRLGRFNPERARENGRAGRPVVGAVASRPARHARRRPRHRSVGPRRPHTAGTQAGNHGRYAAVRGNRGGSGRRGSPRARSDLRRRGSRPCRGNGSLDGARSRTGGGESRRQPAGAHARVRALLARRLDLEREARELFPATQIARDGAEYEIAFPDAVAELSADARQLPVRARG